MMFQYARLAGAVFLSRASLLGSEAAEHWTDHEIDLMRISSPWTQTLGPAPDLSAWFATAQPIEVAEGEARLHKRDPLHEPDPDYLSFLAENREKVFVLAIGYPTLSGLSKEADAWKTVQ